MKPQPFFLTILFVTLFLIPSCDVLKKGISDQGFCGHMVGYEERIKTDREFVSNLERIEKLTQNYIDRIREGGNNNFRTTLVTIPVVAHVVYKNATENVPDAQIQSQIDALNEVFRLANADASTIPLPFQSLATDVLIEFTLAQRDPNCNPTNGITRTLTTVPSFPVGNTVKHVSSGGADAWPSDEYLNMWICDISGGVAGFATFPADLALYPTDDGIVMDYAYFGTFGTVSSPFDLGRIAAHEVGHWLNLRHIWGDDCPGSNSCSGTDFVNDTPNQQCHNTGCPPFPKLDACSPSSPGVMFMNHMDYTNDPCRRMFTVGQSDRMSATLFEVRHSLLGSQGAIPPPTSSTADLWMKDSDPDVGDEPNNNSTLLYLSDDIWVRNANDGLINQESQNPIGGQTNYVYVRVRNKGCNISSSATLKLYWAKASISLGWPQPWDGSVTSPALMGDQIGIQPTGAINGNDFQIYTFAWNNTPLPSDYAIFGADKAHFCLLARIETSSTPPYGMTFPETGILWENVKNNNNIIWKNITIDETSGGGFGSVLLANNTPKTKISTLEFNFLRNAKNNINVVAENVLNEGVFVVELDQDLFKLVQKSGEKNISGFKYLDNRKFQIESPVSRFGNLKLDPEQVHVVNVEFIPKQENVGRKLITLNLLEIDVKKNQIIGGQEFKFLRN